MKKKLGRGHARWAGISKKDRSAEMSRIAKIRAKKYNFYKEIVEKQNLTTQA